MTAEAWIAIVGLFLMYSGMILSTWIRNRNDITAIKVELASFVARVVALEEGAPAMVDRFENKLEKFTDDNKADHASIVNKIDSMKDSISEIKVALAKKSK